jgi:hypothetical protein
MAPNDKKNLANAITLDGVTFKTSGNILFQDAEENPFYLAESPLLDTVEGYLENGMQLLLKKINSKASEEA